MKAAVQANPGVYQSGRVVDVGGGYRRRGHTYAAGAVVRENQVVADKTIAAGVPAKVRGEVSAELAARLIEAPQKYQKYMLLHAQAIAES